MITVRGRIERSLLRGILGMSDRLLRRAVGAPVVRGGRTLDLRVQALLALNDKAGLKPIASCTVPEAREMLEASAELGMPMAPAVTEAPLELAGRPARVFWPAGLARGAAPGLLYLHGGGFVIGSVETHARAAALLAEAAGCAVISLDYRLAPEHPFPAGLQDCLGALRQLLDGAEGYGLDPARIAVGGDSAGGNLSALVALATRGDQRRPCAQLLIYPATDLTYDYPSADEMGEGFLLTRADLRWFGGLYGADPSLWLRPEASPFFEADLRGAPPAFLSTAGFDPLRDDGDRYALRLREAGVPVEHRCEEGLVHGWLMMLAIVPAAAEAFAAAAAFLRQRFNPPAAG
jgi:acetyl esterase